MHRRPSLPRAGALGLCLLALLLFVFQATTLAKFSALAPTVAYGTLDEYVRQAGRVVPLGAGDALLAGLLVGLSAVLVVGEARRHWLSRFVAWGLGTERRALALVGVASLVSVRFYFTPGLLNWGGDAAFHQTYTAIAAATMAQGELPIWTNAFGAGSPYLQFYGFLFYYLAGLIGMVCPDTDTALRIALAGAHVASGLGMYRLVRTLSRSRRAGLVGGLAYVLCFWHTQQVVLMGRFPLGLFYALLPWPFFFFEALQRGPRVLWPVFLGGLSLGGLVFTHPGYALWSLVLLVVYMGLRLAASPVRLRWCLAGTGMVGWGLLCGAYLWLPMWLDRGLTGLAAGMDLSAVPDPSWRQLLSWSNYRFALPPLPPGSGHWHGGYLGLSLVALTGAGLWLAGSRFRRHPAASATAAAGGCLCLSLLMVLAYRAPLFGQLPLLHVFNASRYLLFACFFLALAAGLGTRLLLLWGVRRRRIALFPVVVLAVLVDLGPTTFQHPCMSTANDPLGYADAVYGRFGQLAAPFVGRGELPAYRVMWALGPTHPFLGLGWLHHRGQTPIAQGFQAAELPAAHEVIDPLSRFLGEVLKNTPGAEVPDLADYPFIAQALGSLNVRYLLYTRADESLAWPRGEFAGTPVLAAGKAKGFARRELDQSWSNPEVEGRLRATVADPAFLPTARQMVAVAWVARTMAADPGSGRCGLLPLLDWPGEADLGSAPTVELLGHRVWQQRVEMDLRLDQAAFVRLAYAYYPYLEMSVDGVLVAPFETVDHFLALRLEPGEHHLVLMPRLSPLRRWLLGLDLLALAGAAVLWWRRR